MGLASCPHNRPFLHFWPPNGDTRHLRGRLWAPCGFSHTHVFSLPASPWGGNTLGSAPPLSGPPTQLVNSWGPFYTTAVPGTFLFSDSAGLGPSGTYFWPTTLAPSGGTSLFGRGGLPLFFLQYAICRPLVLATCDNTLSPRRPWGPLVGDLLCATSVFRCPYFCLRACGNPPVPAVFTLLSLSALFPAHVLPPIIIHVRCPCLPRGSLPHIRPYRSLFPGTAASSVFHAEILCTPASFPPGLRSTALFALHCGTVAIQRLVAHTSTRGSL